MSKLCWTHLHQHPRRRRRLLRKSMRSGLSTNASPHTHIHLENDGSFDDLVKRWSCNRRVRNGISTGNQRALRQPRHLPVIDLIVIWPRAMDLPRVTIDLHRHLLVRAQHLALLFPIGLFLYLHWKRHLRFETRSKQVLLSGITIDTSW